MDLALLWPAGLLALAALAVPLLLHLRRATEARRVEFAALRWLSPRQRPRRRLRLREWLLLLLRLLLVALVALLMAGPARVPGGQAPPEVLVAISLHAAAARSALPGLPPDTRWRWLAPGLPLLDGSEDFASATPPALASLLREADARAPVGALLHVVVPPVVDGADGERPRLAHPVRWHVLPAPTPAPESVIATPTLVLQAEPGDSAAIATLRAVAQAWMPAGATEVAPLVVAGLSDALPPTDRWLVRVDDSVASPALEDWVRAGGTALLVPRHASAARATHDADADASVVAWRRADGTALARVRTLGRGRFVLLQHPLEAAAFPELLDAGFPRDLQALLDARDPASTQAPADALRPVAGGPRFPPVPAPLAPWLAVAAAGVLLLERWLATRLRREAGP